MKLLGPSLAVVWSISCTCPHSFQHGNTVPLPHPQKIPKWDRPHKYSRLLHGTFLPISFQPMFDVRESFKECEGDLFFVRKIVNKEITFLLHPFRHLSEKIRGAYMPSWVLLSMTTIQERVRERKKKL